jgi:PAS domain S-box-containing protein
MAAKIRVLYVDDESTLLELCKMFLERSGNFAVTITTSAPEAIRILGQERYDAIVSDYQMPDMDGIELLKRLKATGDKTPFIIFTGKGREEVAIEALNAGADFYLQKGGEPKSQFADLSHKIKKAVEGRQTADAFKGSEERYRNLFHRILNGFAVHEILCDDAGKPYDYRFLDINPAFEKMTGLTRESVIGKTVLEVLPKTEPTWIERYGKVALTGEPDYFVEHSGEFDKFFEVTVYQNAPRQFTTIFSDMTERKRAEEALRESEEKYRSYIDNAPNGVFIANEEGYYLEVNPAACTITGYTKKELLQMRIPDLLPDESYEVATRHFQRAIETGQAFGEFAFRHKDSSLRYWSVDAVKLSSTRFLGFVQEITGRKQAEEQLKLTVDKLKRFNNLTVDRELHLIELKKEINALQKKAGEPEKYRIGT